MIGRGEKEQLGPRPAAEHVVPIHVSYAQRLFRNACPGFYGLHLWCKLNCCIFVSHKLL